MGIGSFLKGKKPKVSKQTKRAARAFENFETGPLLGEAGDLVSQILGGQFLGRENPFRDEAIAAATAPVEERFRTSIAPSISAAASRYGRSGSPAEAAVFRDATRDFGRGLAETSAKIGFQDYATERQNQVNAIAQALGITQLEGAEQNRLASGLAQAGAIKDGIKNRKRSGGFFGDGPLAGNLGNIFGSAIGGAAGTIGGPIGQALGSQIGGSLFGGGPQPQGGGR